MLVCVLLEFCVIMVVFFDIVIILGFCNVNSVKVSGLMNVIVKDLGDIVFNGGINF